MNLVEKRCPSCSVWNKYNLEEKKCKTCGSLMDKNEIAYEEKKRKGLLPPPSENKPILEIKDSYPLPLKIVLHVVRPVYFTFMFIVSGIIWFVVWASA